MLKVKKQEILAKLKEQLPSQVCDTLKWPQAYSENTKNVRAIVLGCDPSNKHSHNLGYAFGINTKLSLLKGFFKSIETNLHEIDLDRKVVYVQNLCQNYFTEETGKNPHWKAAAEIWIPYLKEELSVFPNSVPVLLTAEILYKVLLNDDGKPKSATYLYSNPSDALIPASQNKLGRTLIPFYRFDRGEKSYHLSMEKWKPYRIALREYFKKSSKRRQMQNIEFEVVYERDMTEEEVKSIARILFEWWKRDFESTKTDK